MARQLLFVIIVLSLSCGAHALNLSGSWGKVESDVPEVVEQVWENTTSPTRLLTAVGTAFQSVFVNGREFPECSGPRCSGYQRTIKCKVFQGAGLYGADGKISTRVYPKDYRYFGVPDDFGKPDRPWGRWEKDSEVVRRVRNRRPGTPLEIPEHRWIAYAPYTLTASKAKKLLGIGCTIDGELTSAP